MKEQVFASFILARLNIDDTDEKSKCERLSHVKTVCYEDRNVVRVFFYENDNIRRVEMYTDVNNLAQQRCLQETRLRAFPGPAVCRSAGAATGLSVPFGT